MIEEYGDFTPQDNFTYTSNSLEQSRVFANKFITHYIQRHAHLFPPILLFGKVGSGKSFLTQAYLECLSLIDLNHPFASPSYTLVHEYLYPLNSQLPSSVLQSEILFHVDLYRLKKSDELEVLGVLDKLYEHIVIIEWADIAVSKINAPFYSVYIDILSEDLRCFNVTYTHEL